MGVKVYWMIVAAVIILGLILPQSGQRKKTYVVTMALLHTFICAFRYNHLTGDLMKYNSEYINLADSGWFSEEVFHEGRNAGFYWLMKLVAQMSGNDFQMLLIIIAIVIEVCAALLIYRYSSKPWLSYLVWNCLGFYIFGFSAIKQALAMSLLMVACIYIFERKLSGFLIFTLLAGFIHMPALCFLPAYWVANRRINLQTIIVYLVATAIIYLLRNQIVEFVTDMYYEDNDEISFMAETNVLGGRFFLIVLILLAGLVLKGFREKNFEALFNLLVVAAVFQMFSNYDNVFTRLADYYFQFTVLFIPAIFFESDRIGERYQRYSRPIIPFNKSSLAILAGFLCIALIWWYWRTNLGVTISYEVDNYLNFRFMWDVVN